MTINPIVPGFSPDPSIVKVGDWYFLVNSTFHLFPCLPVYASQDLVSWRQIGNAIHRPGQLSLSRSTTTLMTDNNQAHDTMLASGGLYAPSIRHYQGTFYIICTNVVRADPTEVNAEEQRHNFIVTCSDIWNCQWSDPITIEFDGIDPSIFWDDDGKSFVQGSGGKGPWTTVNQFQVDLSTGAKLSEEKTIWKGTGGIYPEGPHLYKRNGWYYLLISEGGTYDDHCVTMARSKNIWGPFESNPSNPILTARGTGEPVQHTGHCDICEDGQGQWWGVCLGVRKGQDGSLVMGRETFITPGKWGDDEWFTLEKVQFDPPGLVRYSDVPAVTYPAEMSWLYVRDAHLDNYQWCGESGVTLIPTNVDLSSSSASPTFVARRQRVLRGTSTATMVDLETLSESTDLHAGLAVYKDEHRYIRIFLDAAKGIVVWEVRNKAKGIFRTSSIKLGRPFRDTITFGMDYTEASYTLWCDTGSHAKETASFTTLDLTGPDFVGPVIGIFACSENQGSTPAIFQNIEVQ